VPKEGDKIVYIDGAFDLFHVGHVHALKQAKELGDFLIVGVHSDQELNAIRGTNYPIMNLHERALCVLSCKYADEVIIGAPIDVSDDFIDQWKVNFVVHGDENDEYAPSLPDPYRFAKERGIYRAIKATEGLTTQSIIERILQNRAKYAKRNADREKKEALLAAQKAATHK